MSKDLMYKDEIQQLVVDAYRALDAPGGPATRFYTGGQLADVPADARQWALGVGNPVACPQEPGPGRGAPGAAPRQADVRGRPDRP